MENNEKARNVRYSQTTLTELMIPSYANFGGKIHGGILLSLMDKVAYVCAAKHAGSYCVTVSVDNVSFKYPVEVGDLVMLHASVNYVGRSSLVIGIKVVSENIESGYVRHTNTSYFTMVAKDKMGNLAMVPELILENTTDVRRFMEAMVRKELRETYKDEFDNEKSRMKAENHLELLQSERCQLALGK